MAGFTHSSSFVGTAGWSLPSALKAKFPEPGAHLERYARVFNAVEINSSFYREHKPETYIKWASMVPDTFRFSVKLSRYFTQEGRLKDSGSRLQESLNGISGLGEKWGALLVQLPPSLEFDLKIAQKFLGKLRKDLSRPILWEPRHPSWAQPSAVQLLAENQVSKVLADPEPCRINKEERVRLEYVRYFRLHGTPEIYKSKYSPETIARIARHILNPLSPASQTWCIFDNTTFGHATENARELRAALAHPPNETGLREKPAK